MNAPSYRGRIAPSPTGFLHLGHAKTFWTAYHRCEEGKGVMIYRDEDIDPHRCKKKFSEAAEQDLKRLGITWHDGPFRQSDRLPSYREALVHLSHSGLVYPCPYSRKHINEADDLRSSPRGENIFPESLRPGQVPQAASPNLATNWRFKVPDGRDIDFTDLKQGPQSFKAGLDFGDFLVWRKEGVPSYELAVVVDDLAMEITEVVRGADLLVSTARQLLLYEAFGSNPPAFYHEDLVRDASGERLAKQKDSLALRHLFDQGHDFESIARLWTENS